MSTICAIATAPGGAIGIIRISGPHAIIHATRIFHPACGVPLEERKPASLTFGTIVDPSTNEVVDEVLISLFRAPHSYTGEDAIEISCHGSSYILQRIMQLLIETGCRMATAGEYTKRAFLNGKMDLSEAEAVADLIASQDAATHRLAINQMRGGFGREFATLRNQLLHINTLLELELDFSDHEDIEFADRSTLNILATEIEKTIATLTQSFAQGNAIKNGVPVAIVGQTNAGKSTLLNTLLNEEKAIVSSIHGTTRDTIEDTFYLHGIRFRLIDTAGLRTTNDEIENIGINRTLQRISQSDIVAWIIDGTETLEKALCLYDEITSRITPKQWLIPIINKADLLSLAQQEALLTAFVTLPQAPTPHTPPPLFISARSHDGIDHLEQLLLQAAALPTLSESTLIVTNVRHYTALNAALNAIRRARLALNQNLSGDLISEDLRECINQLGEIVAQGSITPDETLQNIFSQFCIGK